MNDTPDFLTGGTTQGGTDEGSGEHGSRCEPPEFVLVERQRAAEDEAVETGRRARRRIERLRVADRQSKRHGTPFLAQQRCLVTDREGARERGDGRSGQVDGPSGGRFVPSSKNQSGEIRRIRISSGGGCFRQGRAGLRAIGWRVGIHGRPWS